ncbi:MAG: EAL domain-containing protein [Pseudomonadales bacterium]
MKIGPQLRIAFGLVALLTSTLLIADFVGLMPRPEDQVRESRKLLSESLAVQLSSVVGNGQAHTLSQTVKEIVRRNEEVDYAGLWRENGLRVASFGEEALVGGGVFDFSSFESLVVPIYQDNRRWGEVRLQFAASDDWALRYLGFPTKSLQFIGFIGVASLLTFFLFMKKVLSELNPTKVVPQRVNAAFDVLAEGVVIVDESERIVLANRSFADRIGATTEQLVGRDICGFDWDLKGDELEVLPWQDALARGEHIMGMPLSLRADGEETAFTANAAPIEDGQGQSKGVLITLDDVTPLEAKNTELAGMLAKLGETQELIQRKNKELEVLATRDPLTGSLNRRSFMERYQRHFDAAAGGNADLVVLMIDIDFFKQINDDYGHGVGDEAIVLVAHTLQKMFRKQSVVARYGGEEFVVALPNVSLKQGKHIADRVCKVISEKIPEHPIAIEHLTVSLGVSAYAPEIKDSAQLLDQADRGLYKAKESGRNQACLYDSSFVHAAKEATADSSLYEAGDTEISSLREQLEEMQSVVQDQAEEITHKAMHDELTGLPNRFLLLDRMTQAMRQSARNSNLAAVVSLSLSDYQRISGAEGSEAADWMLGQAAERLEGVVRSVDTIGVAVNDQALTLSRISHNELAMLIVDIDSVESIPKIIGRVTSALERPFIHGDSEYLNRVHCGIAVFPNDGNKANLLIRNATLARSYAERRSPKASGNAYFSKSIDNLSIKNAKMARELRKAIQNDQLKVMYQPKVNSATGAVTGVEALARWHHPELGHVGPMEFITVAEHIGVIDQLTNWVLRKVCTDIRSGVLGPVRVSINVSPLELCDPNTGNRLLEIIEQCGIFPTQIEVEITESSVLENFDLTRSILSQLQEEGVHVALDDFGTAYSSLNLLLEMPVDVIKIDRSFVTDIQHAEGNQAVVRAIIQMADAMRKRVVAEGVENTDERDCLSQMGCREIQGYLYSKPMAFSDLVSYVAKKGTAAPRSNERKLQKSA